IKENDVEQIYLCLDFKNTDACVLKTALDLFENNYEVYVLKEYCMSGAGQKIHNDTNRKPEKINRKKICNIM
ncbi:MAG: hypothetical protein V8R26_05800, partial [Clostridia bacterium]